jgi:hypothetical protein
MFGIDKKKKITSPVEFVKDGEDYRSSAISYIEKDINGVDRFAILKTTEGGKYMRGNTLFYSLDGIEIYTESTNVIFVDLVNKTLFIKEYEKVLNEINPTDPEQRQYIMLYTDLGYENDEEEFPLRWEAVSGRSQAYENIKVNAPVIDIDKSLVLVETVAFKDSLTVRQFIDYMKNGGFIKDETFDINDFSGSDYI